MIKNYIEKREEEFNDKFRPTYKRNFTENDTISMPSEIHEWVDGIEKISDFNRETAIGIIDEMIKEIGDDEKLPPIQWRDEHDENLVKHITNFERARLRSLLQSQRELLVTEK